MTGYVELRSLKSRKSNWNDDYITCEGVERVATIIDFNNFEFERKYLLVKNLLQGLTCCLWQQR